MSIMSSSSSSSLSTTVQLHSLLDCSIFLCKFYPSRAHNFDDLFHPSCFKLTYVSTTTSVPLIFYLLRVSQYASAYLHFSFVSRILDLVLLCISEFTILSRSYLYRGSLSVQLSLCLQSCVCASTIRHRKS